MSSTDVSESRAKLHKELIEHHVVRSCLNCENWSGLHNECLEFETIPPPEVIVYGCKQWTPAIPF